MIDDTNENVPFLYIYLFIYLYISLKFFYNFYYMFVCVVLLNYFRFVVIQIKFVKWYFVCWCVGRRGEGGRCLIIRWILHIYINIARALITDRIYFFIKNVAFKMREKEKRSLGQKRNNFEKKKSRQIKIYDFGFFFRRIFNLSLFVIIPTIINALVKFVIFISFNFKYVQYYNRSEFLLIVK